uniref:Uncharacterized protein n=1 Tax=Clytia hemisphaerica TaxID=252671 RepID=A0A7M5WZB2_9CNID
MLALFHEIYPKAMVCNLFFYFKEKLLNKKDNNKKLLEMETTGLNFKTKVYKKSSESTIHKIFEQSNNQPMTYHDVLTRLSTNQEFRQFFSSNMTELMATEKAYFWECTPTSQSTIKSMDFTFILNPSKQLERMSCDRASFKEHFDKQDTEHWTSINFHNLGRDAVLVAPVPMHGTEWYTHLASFQRAASEDEKSNFWEIVGQSMLERVTETKDPVWLSTSGLGVGWLHVRIDKRPKYYTFEPFRRFPVAGDSYL